METKNTIQITPTSDNQFISDIIQIIRNGKDKAYAAVNASMIATYWNIGRRIVFEEQKGELCAEYGTQLLKKLSIELTKEIGKGFTERNLRNFAYSIFNFPTTRFGTRAYQISPGHISEEDLRREIEKQKEIFQIQQVEI